LKRKIQLVLMLSLLCVLLWSSLGFSKPGLSTGKSDPENTEEGLPVAGLHLHNDFNNENNWPTISGISTNYVKLEDINPSMVPEIKMDLNTDSLRGLIVRETNNGLLCGYKVFDIVVSKLAKDGQVIQQKGFGGSGFENLDGAKYDKNLGMIINGHTTSQNGDFGLPEGQKFTDFVARIAVNLSLQWVVKTNENEHFVYNQLGLADGYVYVLGDKRSSAVEGTLVSGFLIKLDENGNRVWLKSDLHKGLWGSVLSLLPLVIA